MLKHVIDVSYTLNTTVLTSRTHSLTLEYLSDDFQSPEDFLCETMGYKHEDFFASGEDEETLEATKFYWI